MTMMISGEIRLELGKNASRRLRREGKLPGVLYGSEENTIPLVLDKKEIINILRSETGENSLVKVKFHDEKRDAMIKDLQLDPVSDELLHVDLIQISMDKLLRVEVSIDLIGEAVGVKNEGGFIDFVTREIEIECLPKDIPDHIDVDISDLHLHQSLKVEDLVIPEGVKLLTDDQTVLVLIQAPTVEAEKEEPEEEEILAEEEEPEVISKEREEEEKE